MFCFLLQSIDAIDNGINQYDTDLPPRYVNSTHLSSRVGRLNLDWVDPDQSAARENEAFQRAMNLAGGEFLEVGIFYDSISNHYTNLLFVQTSSVLQRTCSTHFCFFLVT